MKLLLSASLSLLVLIANGQSNLNYLDATVGVAKYQGAFSVAWMHQWKVGKKQKLGIGLGGRLTTYLAANQYYVTAPAELTSESTSPFIIFKDNITANMDTFLVKSPQVNSINLSINITYPITPKLTTGFNIDAIGFSFGGKQAGNYINGLAGKMVNASPTHFNALLISDNDRGSLNSEFYLRYALNDAWGLKFGAQFLFTEYTTDSKVQVYPVENDRFRNKSLLLCFGVSLKL